MLTDLLGKELATGRIGHRREWNALEGSLASWLTVEDGASSFQAASAGIPYVQVVTDGTNGDSAIIRGPEIKQASFREIRWTVQGLRLSTDTALDFYFGVWGTTGNNGSRMRQDEDDDYPVLEEMSGAGAATALETVPLLFRTDATKRFDLTYRVLLLEARAYLLLNGHVVCATGLTPDGTADAQVYPRIQVTAKEAAAKNFQCSRIVLDLIHN